MKRKQLRQVRNRLKCQRKGHNYERVWMTRNMYVCKRCGEPGWMV